MVDPLNLEIVQDDEVVSQATGLHANAEALALRMLNNLKSMAFAEARLDEVLNLVELQLAIASTATAKASLYYEQGDVWARYQAISSAREAFQNCLEVEPEGNLARQAVSRLQQLDKRRELRH